MKYIKWFAICGIFLLLGGCVQTANTPPIGRSLEVEQYTAPTQNYTLSENAKLEEYLLTFEEHVDNIYYYDYTFYDSDTLLLTCAFEEDGTHMGATIYHMDLKDMKPVAFYHTQVGYDGPTSYRDIYANPTPEGSMVYEDGTLVFFDRDFKETKRFSLETINEEIGGSNLLFNPDYTKAAVTLSDDKEADDMTKEYILYLYDLESGQRTEIAKSYSLDDQTPPAYGGAAIPVPMHWSQDGTLLYRHFQWEWFLDGFSFYYPDGTTKDFTYEQGLMGEDVGPVQFLGNGSNRLVCNYTGYGNAASSIGIYDVAAGTYTPLSLAGDHVYPWWNEQADTAFYIDNILFDFGLQPTQEDRVEYGVYKVDSQERIPLMSHPVYDTERTYLELGFPTMSILGQTDDNTHYGYAVAPDGNTIVAIAEIDHNNYFSLLTQN